MKLNIAREGFLPTLSLVGSVVEKRQTLPILANLHLTLEKGTLSVLGSDLEVETTEVIEGVEGDDGTLTVSTENILNIANKLPEDATVTVKQVKDNVVVTSGRSRYTLRTLPPAEYPRIVTEDWEERFKISQLALKTLLKKTSFAMAVNDVRFYLNGILLVLDDKCLRAVATDGHRLAQSEVSIDHSASEPKELIIPRKAVAEMHRVLEGEGDAEITVELNPNHLRLSKGETVLTAKLIDGKFPEFKGVLETKPEVKVTVNRDDFFNGLDRVSVLTDSTDRYTGVKLNLDKEVLRATTTNIDKEEAMDEMSVEYDGKPIESGYNVYYLMDATKECTHENIEIHLQGNDGICILKQPDDEHTIWLIMPMRI